MIWVGVVLVTVVAVFAFLQTPFRQVSTDLLRTTRKSLHIISSRRISDHWKARVLPRYAGQMFKSSLILLFCLLVLIFPVIAGDWIASLWSLDLVAAMTTWEGLGLSIFTASIQVGLIRSRSDRDQLYGPLQKILHYGVLSTPGMGEALFALEVWRTGRADPSIATGRHVFVNGLARSGTTVLMRSLYESGQFGSLTYADMPFVMAPNFWEMLKDGVRKGPVRERAHGDGVLVDYSSPEALDEVFWQTFVRDDYVHEALLTPHSLSEEMKLRFLDYVGVVLKHCQKERYLSKNNNNVLRVDGLCELFPNAVILVPFRDPLQQAASLLNQHRLFCKRQRSERFTRSYMGWLGHYEFGVDHRRMVFNGVAFKHRDPAKLEYWLEQWVVTYRYLLECAQANADQVLFVGYDLLCETKEGLWPRLCERLGLPTTLPTALSVQEKHSHSVADTALLEVAKRLHENLNQRCLACLKPELIRDPNSHR